MGVPKPGYRSNSISYGASLIFQEHHFRTKAGLLYAKGSKTLQLYNSTVYQ
jgi:hypothetical protein